MSSSPPKINQAWGSTNGPEPQILDNSPKCSRSRTVGSIADSGYGSECTLHGHSEDDKKSLTSNNSIRESYESNRLTPVSKSSVAQDSSIKHSLHKAASKTCKIFSDTIRSKTQMFYAVPTQPDSPSPGKEETPSKRLEKMKSIVSLRGRGGKHSAVDQGNQESLTRTSALANLPHELDVDIPDSNLQGLTLNVNSSDEIIGVPVGCQSQKAFSGAKDFWSNVAVPASKSQPLGEHEESGASFIGASLSEFDMFSCGSDVISPRSAVKCLPLVDYDADSESGSGVPRSLIAGSKHGWDKTGTIFHRSLQSPEQMQAETEPDTEELQLIQSQSCQSTKMPNNDVCTGYLTLGSPPVEFKFPGEVDVEYSERLLLSQKIEKREGGVEGICSSVNVGDPILDQPDSTLRYALEAIERPNGDALDATEEDSLMETSAIQNSVDPIDRFDGVTLDYSDNARLLSLKSIEFAIEAIERPDGNMLEHSTKPQKSDDSIPIAKYKRQVKRSGSRRVLKRSPIKTRECESKQDDISIEKESPLVGKPFLKYYYEGQVAPELSGPYTDSSEEAAVLFNHRTPSSQSVSTSDSCAVTTHSPLCYMTPPAPALHLRTRPARRTSSINNESKETPDDLKDKESIQKPSEFSEWCSAHPIAMPLEERPLSPLQDTMYIASGPEEIRARDIEMSQPSSGESQITKQILEKSWAGPSLEKEIGNTFLKLAASAIATNILVDPNEGGVIGDSKTRSSSMCAPDADFTLDYGLSQRSIIEQSNTRSSSMCAPDEDFKIDSAKPETCFSPRPLITLDTDTSRFDSLIALGCIEPFPLSPNSKDDTPELGALATSRKNATLVAPSTDESHASQTKGSYGRNHDTVVHSITQGLERTPGRASATTCESLGLDFQIFEDSFTLDELPPLPPTAGTPYVSQFSTGSPAAPESYNSKVLDLHYHRQRWMSPIRTSSFDGPLDSQGFSPNSSTSLVPIAKFVCSLSDYFKSKGEKRILCTPLNSPQMPENDLRPCTDYSSPYVFGLQSDDDSATEREFIAARLPLFGKQEAPEVMKSDAQKESLSQKRAASRLRGRALTLTSPIHESGSSIPIASSLNKTRRSTRSKKRSWKRRDSEVDGEELMRGPVKSPKRDLVTSSMKKGIWWGRNNKVVQEVESPLAHKVEESRTNSNIRGDTSDHLEEDKENKEYGQRAHQAKIMSSNGFSAPSTPIPSPVKKMTKRKSKTTWSPVRGKRW